MSSSFSGYGHIYPNSNVDKSYANVDNSHYPGGFGSNEISGENGLPGLSGIKNNVQAAHGFFKGGAKKLKQKIKNITKKYKTMTKCRIIRKTRRLKQMAGSSYKKSMGTKRRHRKHRGGYSQYQNNLPLTRSYSVGGILGANQSALASPPPIKGNNTCVDNYNHYTGKGFASRGHE